MKQFTIILLALCFVINMGMAQSDGERRAVAELQKELKIVEDQEKKALRAQIDNINSLLNNGVISQEEAKKLKLKAAMASTRKIEQRQASLRESIFFLEEKLKTPPRKDEVEIFLDVDNYSKETEGIMIQSPRTRAQLFEKPEPKPMPQKTIPVQRGEIKAPTTLDVVFALGLNNTVSEGITWQAIEDEENYEFYSSRFWEVGLALKTPLWKKNGFRLKYGISYQLNELEPNGNRFFGVADGRSELQQFPRALSESRFLVHNLVLPVHLEFGPTKLKTRPDGTTYYSASNQFKIGVGGYIGYNLDAEQQLEYPILFRRRIFNKLERIDVPNINQQIFGLSGYVGFGAFSIYGKYDLNTIFEDDDLNNEQFVSVGVRIDL
ncbi:hypothetical protein [Allomuricauda sp. d1]|uniref:hypothetical protein n=1 Tax=Allomuricauda sp. d1 TaxID=3136725 RepID=UPI0031DFD9BB